FVQQTWSNNPKFGGLYADSDPLMGQRRPPQMSTTADVFTAQGKPVRQQLRPLPEFVTVRGGAYFFMPGLEALKHLARLPFQLPLVDRSALGAADEPSLEQTPPGEDQHTQELTALLLQKVKDDYPTGTARRDAHAKHHGCVRAEFIVEPDLPAELK